MIPQCKKNIYNRTDLKLKPEIAIPFTPLVGKNHASWGGCYYYKVKTKVTVHIGLNMQTTGRKKIFNIPEGYRPNGTTTTWGAGADGNVPDKSYIEIWPDGDIWVTTDNKFALIILEYDTFEDKSVAAVSNNIEINEVEKN